MNKIFYTFVICTLLVSCSNRAERQQERELYATSQRQLEQKLDRANKIMEEQQTANAKMAQKLEETRQQAEAVRRKDELRQKAENEPIVISNLKVSNVTKHGSVLSSGGPFEKWSIRYIRWECDYEDFVVQSGGKTYGDLYVKYMRKDDFRENSWTVFSAAGYFYMRDGESDTYTQKLSMIDDGKESGSWSYSFGSSDGSAFDRGKWKIELFWDKEHANKAIYLGGIYFEVY
ncbi:hypothetical protein CTM63_02810 [Prevotella intermedia]|jgi:lipoprotein|nr:hypothetical protein CTM63_02810 [Prevotella intermedia]